MALYRHPSAGALAAPSLAAFLESLPLSEQGRVTSALADGLSVARYGQNVFTWGDRRADLPGMPPARLAGCGLDAIIEPARSEGPAVAKSPLKSWHDDADPHRLSGLGSKPRWVRPPQQQPHTETPMVTTGSMRTSPDPRSGRAPMELLDHQPPPARQVDPALDWYRQKLAR